MQAQPHSTIVKQRYFFAELTVKAGTTQTATDTKENGVNPDEKGAASPKLNSSAANKKGRKSRFFKSKEVTFTPPISRKRVVRFVVAGD